MANIEQPKSAPNGVGSLLLGLVLGGGTVALVEEYRLSEVARARDKIVERADSLAEQATPIVSAAAQSQGMSPGLFGNMSQSLPARSSNLAEVTKGHAVSYAEALRDYNQATSKE